MARKDNNKVVQVAKLVTKDTTKEQKAKGDRSDVLRQRVHDALSSTKSIALINKMDTCGTKHDHGNYTSVEACQSLYCAKRKHPKTDKVQSCYIRYVNGQKAKIKTVLKKYPTDAERLKELRQITILFSAFGFDTSGQYPIFPMDIVTDAMDKARKELLYLKNKFPKVRWRGGFSWEVAHPDYLGKKKQKTLRALKGYSEQAGLFYKPTGGFNHLTSPWQDHLITFHCHLILDLNGTDSKEFYDACHKKWGLVGNKKRPVPDGVLIQTLTTKKTIPDSLESMAQYPLRNQFDYHYKFKNDVTDLMEYPQKDLEPEILSALMHVLLHLKKNSQIITQHHWQ